MRPEFKNYLLSVGDRSLGIAYGRERHQQYGLYDGVLSGFFAAMLPLGSEVVNDSLKYMDTPVWSKISAGRAITYACLGIAGSFAAIGIDTAGDFAALMVAGAVNPEAGIALKGVINVGSYMLLDALKYAVHHPPNFRGIPVASV